ncbi:MAG TPA: guanylate kinase [Bryobacteraceae bacterium]|jgi:guanylate kinase|nr:guanylate kinase [Bryobacteraceae bacterium]
MSTVFIISAPSGSGKSTLVARLLHEVENLTFSVSYTTRKPRGLEVNGQAYHFIERPEFEKRIEAGEFLEYADVFGNYYGTHSSALTDAEAAGDDLVLDIDVQGAAQLKKRIPDAVTIFVLAPSREILEMRLRARSQDNEEVIRRRLADAAREIGNWYLYDYVVVNNDLNLAAETLKSIVRAERVRRSRVEKQIRPILASFDQELGVKT